MGADAVHKEKSSSYADASGRATVVAAVVALVLVMLKLVVGILSGSISLIASAVDSGLDFLISMFNYFAIRGADMPSDEKYNYGRGKIEGIASALEGLLIGVSAFIIIASSVVKIVQGGSVSHTNWAMMVMVISALGTAGLVAYMNAVAKKTGNLVTKADALHYRVDLWTNLGILVALGAIKLTGWHLIDPLLSIGIAILILRETYKLIKQGVWILLDRALPEELIKSIQEIITSQSQRIKSYHMLKTRQAANVNFMDVHVVFDRGISLLEAHGITDQIERKIRKLEDRKWIINIHMDPFDDYKRDVKL